MRFITNEELLVLGGQDPAICGCCKSQPAKDEFGLCEGCEEIVDHDSFAEAMNNSYLATLVLCPECHRPVSKNDPAFKAAGTCFDCDDAKLLEGRE